MKRHLLLPFCVALLTVTQLHAIDFNRIYIGGSVTADATYRYLNKNFVPSGATESQVRGVIEYSNKHSFPEVGVIGGIKLGVNITHFFAIESGLQYSWMRYRYESDQFYTLPVYSGSVFNPADSFKTTNHNTYHYIDIPVALNFSIGKKKVRGIISLGADLGFLIKKKIAYTYTYADGRSVSDEQTTYYNNYRTFNVSPFLGIGMDCHLGKTFVLRLMPIAQIQALKNINTPVSEYLWNAGLNVSFLFGFIKVQSK
jgi:hypothetical protein